MDRHQTDGGETATRRSAFKRPSRAQRHLLGPAFRRTVARPAQELRAIHDMLQSLRSRVTGADPEAVSPAQLPCRAAAVASVTSSASKSFRPEVSACISGSDLKVSLRKPDTARMRGTNCRSLWTLIQTSRAVDILS